MHIGIATLSDINSLSLLLSVLFSQEDEFSPDKLTQEKGLKKIIQNPYIGHIIVARDKDKIVGMLTILYTVSTALGSRVGILEDMIVDAQHRGQGVGDNLMKYCLEFAKKQNLKRLTLLTDNSNKHAHDFYLKHDFVKSSMIPFRNFF